MDPLAQFKELQKQGWAHFAPLEAQTTPAAGRLVKYARVHSAQTVLDVACGTGVVAITCARRSARVTGLDLTPELIERARENAQIANVTVEWHEGDAEQLPFADATFDVVLSQFGHIFAPRPDVAIGQMLRVLKRGGTIAFASWPPEHSVGRSMVLVARYLPPPPPGVLPPWLWGDPNIVRERLGDAVTDIVFDRGTMLGVESAACARDDGADGRPREENRGSADDDRARAPRGVPARIRDPCGHVSRGQRDSTGLPAHARDEEMSRSGADRATASRPAAEWRRSSASVPLPHVRSARPRESRP
jgi:SAM-dependent methyltransferase